MSEMPLFFAQPEFARLLWVWAALVLVLVWLERRGSDALDRLVSSALQTRLVVRPARWRRWARIALLGISGFAMIVALMQPQWGLRFVATPRVGAEIMIALDVSRSMLADDAKPSRLERAKAEISDLLSYLDDDYVGLIVFAGRASVLSPMTPDKSFLRLALESAGPHSITRGGTRLAEPILRAVAGMGEPGPAQRALILITDGEDHDSFVIDAAKAAAEAGIKIITIGFGDESGSRIYLRDPKTGARSLLRDVDGQAVVSRLDGELLREIALTTDGAFVPAGTGVLDLASIYEAHIADLTRGQLDERGRSIRDEAYQFFVLLGIVCLIGAVSTSVGSRSRGTAAATTLFFVLVSFLPSPVSAQSDSAAGPAAALETSDRERTLEDPRERFNRANQKLGAGDPVGATVLLRDARRDAIDDVELRYAATYNLGMAASARADALLGDNRSESLEALYEAADWYREAAAARPEATDPRHNLDVTLRRALILADEIAQESQGELEAELDAMIESQRERVLGSAILLEEIARVGELDAAETLRSSFRDAATQQRMVLAEANALAERVERERQGLANKPENERSPEEVLRAGQLESLLSYLDSAIDRMGQTRRQLRQRRAERAYRRGSNALGELKRARDQLRDPVEQIGILLSEVGRLAQSTFALAGVGLSEDAALPAFLTGESVEADSAEIEARVRELSERFALAAAQAEQDAASLDNGSWLSSDPTRDGSIEELEARAARVALIEAAPLVGNAAEAMTRVTEALGADRFRAGLEDEVVAAEVLEAAQERFFDLRQLLNATFANEEKIEEGSHPTEAVGGAASAALAHALMDFQRENLERALRLETLLAHEEQRRIARVEAERTGGSGAANPATPSMQTRPREGEVDPAILERQRFGLARQRLALASGAMMETTDALLGAANTETDPPDPSAVEWPVASEAAGRAAAHLDAIRTLFFSIVEHIRKLAMDQVEVQDQTQDVIALSVTEEAGSDDAVASEEDPTENEESVARGPVTFAQSLALGEEQGELQSRAEEISDALLLQAKEIAQADPQEAGPEAAVDGEKIRKAAEFVASAGLAMLDAGTRLKSESAALEPARDAQALAIEDLKEALALLSPPPEQSEQDESEASREQDQGEPGDTESSDSEQGSQAPAAAEQDDEERMDDPSQLLQGVRDREAERRRDRDRRAAQRRAEPVEKDW